MAQTRPARPISAPSAVTSPNQLIDQVTHILVTVLNDLPGLLRYPSDLVIPKSLKCVLDVPHSRLCRHAGLKMVHRGCLLMLVALLAVCLCKETAKDKSKNLRGILRQKETNPIDFIRLVAMRLIYGVAVRFGLGEPITEALNGAFVPPGVDDYDEYGDFDVSDSSDYD